MKNVFKLICGTAMLLAILAVIIFGGIGVIKYLF